MRRAHPQVGHNPLEGRQSVLAAQLDSRSQPEVLQNGRVAERFRRVVAVEEAEEVVEAEKVAGEEQAEHSH